MASQVALEWLPRWKNLPAVQETEETRVSSLGQEDSLEESIATHFSILAWEIPWREVPGELESVGYHRVGHDWSDLAHVHSSYRKYLLK